MSKHTFKRLVLAVALDDGTEYPELVVTNRAHIAWDLRRVRERWPESGDAAFLWMTFVAWTQLRNDDLYSGKWEKFQEDCLHVETVRDPFAPDDAKSDDVDPTRAESAEDSASESQHEPA